MKNRIMIVGGGTGGTFVANLPARKLRREIAAGQVELVLISNHRCITTNRRLCMSRLISSIIMSWPGLNGIRGYFSPPPNRYASATTSDCTRHSVAD
jgi:hypothetical protein